MKADKTRLSMDKMLTEPYADIEIRELMKSHVLDIERFPLGSYIYYTPRQLKAHYELEVKLADRLRNASKSERRELYSTVYDELFRKITYHPQLIRKARPEERERKVKRTAEILKKYLRSDSVFMEIGPGDCKLSFEVCKFVKRVYAIDVSKEVTKYTNLPGNFDLIISDGSSIDVPEESVSLAYSNQLMEHLHPEDAIDQLKGIHRALAIGGRYYCVTPHRFGGPTDISRFFDEEAKGFHLKEYVLKEIYDLFSLAGFDDVCLPRKFLGNNFDFPIGLAMFGERLIGNFSYQLRRSIYLKLKDILSIRVIGTKSVKKKRM